MTAAFKKLIPYAGAERPRQPQSSLPPLDTLERLLLRELVKIEIKLGRLHVKRDALDRRLQAVRAP